MKIISILIISLGLFLTTTLIGIRLLTLKPVFMGIYTYPFAETAFQLSQSIWDESVLDSFALTPAEASHMRDVAQLINTLIRATVFMDVLGLILWLKTRIYLYQAAAALVVGLISMVTAVLLSWNWFFTTFHQVFFPQGNWSFPLESTLITLYPDRFWFMNAVILFVFEMCVFGLLFVADRFGNRMPSMRRDDKLKPVS